MLDHIRAAVLGFLASLGLSSSPGYQGYGEGDYVLMSPQIGGTVETLSVARGQTVHKGDVLFELEHASEQDAVDQAKAQVEQYKVALRIAEINYARDQKQIKVQAVSRATLDTDLSIVDQATATLSAAQANLAQAVWKLDQKKIMAPADALVIDTIYRVGETVNAGQPVVSLLPPSNIRVRFFVPEPALANMALGQGVSVAINDKQQPLKAHISFIAPQAEYSPPELYNRDNRDKLLYMLEATPDATPERIHPGQPVDVRVDEVKN